jgi:DNA invertase Pin-like site-specific DNA recombinase
MLSSDKGKRLRVAVYCRISLARYGDLVKTERQEEDCRTLCDRLGWDVAEVFVDPNRSAWLRNRKRPGWNAMLQGIEAGRFDAIVVYHGDRLIRQPWDLELLLRIADEKGIRLASPTGTRNLDSADDRFVLRIEAAQACRESDNTSRRAKRAHEALAAKGVPRKGGKRPYGFEPDLTTIRESEAAVIRELAGRILAGESTGSLVRDLNARGIPNASGSPWYHEGIRKLMCGPRLAGLATFRGEITGPGQWPAILERDTWESVRRLLLGKMALFPQATNARKHLLTNIALCGSCEASLAVRYNSRSESLLAYGCINPACGQKVHRVMEPLDEYVIGRVLRRLSDPQLWERVEAAPDDNGAGAELEMLETRKRQVVDEFADNDDMDPALLRGLLRRLDERIQAARGRIASQHSSHVLSGCQGMSRAAWDALPLDRRRAIVRETFTVTVMPSRKGPGFDRESVRATPTGFGQQ